MVQKKTKKPMGRPRLHKTEGVTFSFRTSQQVAKTLNGALATIKLASGERDTPIAMIVMDSLKLRLRSLSNMGREDVDRAIRALDRALDSYEHVQR